MIDLKIDSYEVGMAESSIHLSFSTVLFSSTFIHETSFEDSTHSMGQTYPTMTRPLKRNKNKVLKFFQHNNNHHLWGDVEEEDDDDDVR